MSDMENLASLMMSLEIPPSAVNLGPKGLAAIGAAITKQAKFKVTQAAHNALQEECDGRMKAIKQLEFQIAALTATLDVYIENNNKLNAQNEEYDKELKLLAKTARAHNMWEFDRLISEVRKRINKLQGKDDG